MTTETKPPTSIRRTILWRIAVVAITLAATAWLQRPDGRLHLFFPAVQGDAILIQTPTGEYILIDGGADPAGLAHTLGQRMPFWQRTLAAVVLTSTDSSQLVGQVAGLQRYHTKRALATPAVFVRGGATLRAWQQLLAAQNTDIQTAKLGDRLTVGDVTIHVLGVARRESGGLLLRISYGATSVVVAQTSDQTSEQQIDRTQPAQLVVFPWVRDPRDRLLEQLRPRAILFSDGQRSDHPVLLTYQDRAIGGAQLYHERNNGAIEWISDGRRVQVNTE